MSEQEAFEKHMLKTYGERWQEIGYPPNEILGVWQACAERKDRIIEQQAAELAALRGFALSLAKVAQTNLPGNYVYVALREFKIIDKNGKPTALLTGNETADGKASA